MRSRTELRLMEPMEAGVRDWLDPLDAEADWRVRRCLGGKLTAICSYKLFDSDVSHVSVGWLLDTSGKAIVPFLISEIVF
jgi:hypothetical protein